MENSIEIQIEKYLAGEMSLKEKEAFEVLIAESDELKEHVALSRQLVEVNEFGSFKRNVLIAEKEYLQSKTKTYKLLYWSAAAVIIFMLGIFSYYQQNSVLNINELYAQHVKEVNMPSFIVQGNAVQKDLEKIEKAFLDNDYEKTIELCDITLKVAPNYFSDLLIYKGVALLKLDKETKALDVFKKLSKSDALDASKGLWYEALVYMKLKDKKALKANLIEITKKTTNYNYAEAASILKNL